MRTYVLTTLATLLTSTTVAFAGITPPEPVTYTCPTLPTTFKVGGMLRSNDGALWMLATVSGIAAGSTVNMGPSDSVKYTGNPVYASIFGKTLWCDGIMTIDGKQYPFVVNDQVPEKNCTSNADKTSFTCKP